MKKIKLGDIYKFQFGEGNINPDNGGEYPIYGSNGIIGGYTKYNNEDTPIIGHIGANAGCVVFGKGKHFVTYNGIMCYLKDGFDKMYAYYLLTILKLQDRAKGSAQPFLTYNMLEDINISVLPYEKQVKIGKILSDLDMQIERNNAMVQKLLSFVYTICCISHKKGELQYAC